MRWSIVVEKEISETVKLFGSEVASRFGKTFGNAVWKEVYRRVDKTGGLSEIAVTVIFNDFGRRNPPFQLFTLGFLGGTLGDMQ